MDVRKSIMIICNCSEGIIICITLSDTVLLRVRVYLSGQAEVCKYKHSLKSFGSCNTQDFFPRNQFDLFLNIRYCSC